MNIAIDGPAGAGKSTIAKLAAKELGFLYVDTGAMYRAIALYLLRKKTPIDDEKALKEALEHIAISIKYEDKKQHVYLNGEDVTGSLREEAVGNMASVSSAKQPVRDKLLSLQRGLAEDNSVIMDGRDIGTNVLPNAELKIYLTASADVRAKRRYDEILSNGGTPDFEKIKADIIKRDEQDMNRKIAPLRQAEDAVYLDTSSLSIPEVVKQIVEWEKERA